MSSEEYFVWAKDRLLTWNDFQGEPDATSQSWMHALSATTLTQFTDFDPIMKSTKIKLKINWVRIEARFVPHRSWVKEGRKTPDLLKHEQGHFDIAELMAREITEKMNKKLKGKSIMSPYSTLDEADKDPQNLITKFAKKEFDILEKTAKFTHEKYDKDTNHGRITNIQHNYNEKFVQLRI